MKFTAILLTIFLLNSCSSNQENKSTASNYEADTLVKIGKKEVDNYWISEEYLNCMKTNLPNNCAQQIEFPIVKYHIGEFYIYLYNSMDRINKLEIRMINHKYYLYATSYSKIPVYYFSIKKDTLVLSRDKIAHTYIYSPEIKSIDKKDGLVGKMNIQLLNKLLLKNGFDIYKELNISDSTYFYCNNEINKNNIISTSGKCDNQWILEKDSNIIFIYKLYNSCNANRWTFKIKKELVFKIIL